MIITKHAEKRMKERLGIPKKSIERIAEKALKEGIDHSETKGRLHKYLDKQYLEFGTKLKWRVYGENLYLFSFLDELITVKPLNNKFKKYV